MHTFNIFSPPPCLKEYVRYFWALDIDLDSQSSLSLVSYVDASQGMSFQITETESVFLLDNETAPLGLLHGLTTAPSSLQLKKSLSAFGLVFYPYSMKEIFGVDAYHFTNQFISIEDDIDRFLGEQLHGAKNTRERIHILSLYLLGRINEKNKAGPFVKLCIDRIVASMGKTTVHNLVRELHTTERQIERRFKEHVGVTPRHFIKTTRFQQALHLIATNKLASLTEIAHQLHYADQSHFIRHFHQLSGLSPTELRKQYNESVINLIL